MEPCTSEVTLRLADRDDARELDRLAQLEGRRLPPGPHVIALRDGTVRALICLRTGDVLADPFHSTLDLQRLLRAHTHPRIAGPRRRRLRLPALPPRRVLART
jgi:hypothetical protein